MPLTNCHQRWNVCTHLVQAVISHCATFYPDQRMSTSRILQPSRYSPGVPIAVNRGGRLRFVSSEARWRVRHCSFNSCYSDVTCWGRLFSRLVRSVAVAANASEIRRHKPRHDGIPLDRYNEPCSTVPVDCERHSTSLITHGGISPNARLVAPCRSSVYLSATIPVWVRASIVVLNDRCGEIAGLSLLPWSGTHV